MLMPASSEFVALCRSQVQAIEALGAALSAVYLTEELVEGRRREEADILIPVVIYPQPSEVLEKNGSRALLPDETDIDPLPWLLEASNAPSATPLDETETFGADANYQQQEGKVNGIMQQRRIVLPLMYEGVVMGLLVTGREDRPWNDRERAQIQRLAQTMAIACVLDQRRVRLERSLSQQQRLQKKQSDLLHNLLHQLRNPLTALKTFGKLLLKRLLQGDANREIVSNILRESDRIQELLQQFDRILELTISDDRALAALPAAQMQEETYLTEPLLLLPEISLAASTLESFSLTDVLNPLLVSAFAIASDRDLKLNIEIRPNLPQARGNPNALREVLSNLIDNALKYTPADGKVYIRAGQERQTSRGRWVGVTVSDTGPGIPPQDLERLFERHYRGVQAQMGIPGTGLGLAIARELIEQMGGEIEVFSPVRDVEGVDAGYERGATFVVWLPVTTSEK